MYVPSQSVCGRVEGRGKQSIGMLVAGLFVTCANKRETHEGREAWMDEGINTCKEG